MTKIHEFDPHIYPFILWVAHNWAAQTMPVSLRGGNKGGVLVILHQHQKPGIDTITHESCHCADYVAETIGMPERTFENGEPYAYLCGWIAKCIDSVVKRKTPSITRKEGVKTKLTTCTKIINIFK